MTTLAAALPAELVRVAAIRERLQTLVSLGFGIPARVDPVVAELSTRIDAAVKAMGEGDLIGELRAYEALKAVADE